MSMKTYQPIAQAFERKMTQLAAMGDPNITRSDAAIRSAMGSAYRAWFADGGMATPYARRLVERAAGFAISRQSWPGHEALDYSTVRVVGQLPGARADESYIEPADVTMAVDEAYARTTARDPRIPVGGLPGAVAETGQDRGGPDSGRQDQRGRVGGPQAPGLGLR